MEYAEGLYLSEQRASFAEKMPRIAAAANNRLWAVWNTHDEEQDYITCKCLENNSFEDYNSVLNSSDVLDSISFLESANINGPEKANFRPVIAASGETAAAVWTTFRDRPAVVGRLYQEGSWGELFTIAEGAHWPEICSLEDGRFFAAYLQEEAGELSIRGKWLRPASKKESLLSEAVLLSSRAAVEVGGEAGGEGRDSAPVNTYRPSVFSFKNQVFVSYDRYSQGSYQVYFCRFRDGKWSAPIRVSEREDWNFLSTVGCDRSGRPWVAWFNSREGANRVGARGHRTTIMLSYLEEEGDHFSRPFYLDLGYGEETPAYYGQQRSLQLRPAAGEGVWLFWEKRDDKHEFFDSTSGLYCKHYTLEEQSRIYKLYTGFSWYSLAGNRVITEKTPFIAVDYWKKNWGDIYLSSLLFGEEELEESHSFLPLEPTTDYNDFSGNIEDNNMSGLAVPAGNAVEAIKTNGETQQHGEAEKAAGEYLESGEAGDSAKTREEVIINGQVYHLYWADLHTHSKLSRDIEGEIDELYNYARDRAGLDIYALTDHDVGIALGDVYSVMTNGEWELLQYYAELYNQEGEFVTFPGYEYTLFPLYENPKKLQAYDHRVVIYPERIEGRFTGPREGKNLIADLIKHAAAKGGFTFPHHETKTWSGPHETDASIEICSAWNVYMRHPEPVHRVLRERQEVGFMGGSDTHRHVPGNAGALSGIYARELSRKAVWEAIENHRVFATNGSRIMIDFTINDVFMGGRLNTGANPVLKLRVKGEKELRGVEIHRVDGSSPASLVKTIAGEGSRVIEASWEDQDWNGEYAAYYLHVIEEGAPRNLDKRYAGNIMSARGGHAWSSPIYVYGE